MTREKMYYEDVFRGLNRNKVKYLVVGGIAVNLYGVPRLTADIDIMVDLSSENVKNLVYTLEKLGYKPRIPVKAIEFADIEKRKKWKKEKGMRVFSFFNPSKPFESVDIFVENPIDFKVADRNKKVIKADEIEIPVVSLEHLIELKQSTGRKQDIADIKALGQARKIRKKENLSHE